MRMKFDAQAKNMRVSEMEEWGQVKRKEVRNLLISDFALRLLKEEIFTHSPRRLYALISLALQLKVLAPENVDLQNGRIVDIKGVREILRQDPAEWALSRKSKA